MQTVQFNHWEYRPSNCDAVAAAAAAADCDAGDFDDGQTLDALECRPRRLDKACRPSDDSKYRLSNCGAVKFNDLKWPPSNSTVTSADREKTEAYLVGC